MKEIKKKAGSEPIGIPQSLFFFYHNKIHPLTNYKAIKNKSNKTRQHRTQNLHKTYTA